MNNAFTLKDKIILITGASSGIGKATALLCAEMGANLIITGRTEHKLNETYSSLSGKDHKKIVLDFENESAITDLVSSIDHLDGIVHSAGIVDNIPFQYIRKELINKIFEINFNVPLIITKELLKNKILRNNGSVVYLSSLVAVGKTYYGATGYSGTKGAISTVIKVMALELAKKKIRVNAVCPGMVRTEMVDNLESISKEQLTKDEKENYPLGYGTPEQVANSIVFLLSDASSWITGTNLIIDGGATIH